MGLVVSLFVCLGVIAMNRSTYISSYAQEVQKIDSDYERMQVYYVPWTATTPAMGAAIPTFSTISHVAIPTEYFFHLKLITGNLEWYTATAEEDNFRLSKCILFNITEMGRQYRMFNPELDFASIMPMQGGNSQITSRINWKFNPGSDIDFNIYQDPLSIGAATWVLNMSIKGNIKLIGDLIRVS